VRIYPADAFIKSYTYEPGLGMSSAIEENGRTLFYEYDSMGRLIHIKNEKGGIETKYSYHYKGGN
jgi:YD repeat-containing protein